MKERKKQQNKIMRNRSFGETTIFRGFYKATIRRIPNLTNKYIQKISSNRYIFDS